MQIKKEKDPSFEHFSAISKFPHLENSNPQTTPVKKRRGRPPGRKNNKTIQKLREAEQEKVKVPDLSNVKVEKTDNTPGTFPFHPAINPAALFQLGLQTLLSKAFPQTSQVKNEPPEEEPKPEEEPEWKAYAYKYKPKVYSCEVCKEKFNSAFSFKQHEMSHQDLEPGQIPEEQLVKKKFHCDECDKDFQHKPDFDAHNYYSHWREAVVPS